MENEAPENAPAETSDVASDESHGMSLGLRALMGFSLVIVIVLLYILSVGPIGLLYERMNLQGTWGGTVIELFYFPLLWLYENTAFSEPLDWYLELWGTD